MLCPNCKHQGHLEIDLHADGFSGILLECSECDSLLVAKGRALETVNGPAKPLGVMQATNSRQHG